MFARGLLLVGVAALVAGACLSLARFGAQDSPRGLTVVLVDASASVRRTRPTQDDVALQAALAAARDATAAERDFALIRVARDVRTVLEPGPAAAALQALASGAVRLAPEGDDEAQSALVEGVATATMLFDGHGERELVLATDGAATDGKIGVALARLVDDGVAVRCIPLAPEEAFDAEVARLVASDVLEPGASLAVLAEVAWLGEPGARDCALVVRATNSGGESVRRARLDLAANATSTDARGRTMLALQLDLGPIVAGDTRVEARLEFSAPDSIPENDSLERWVSSGEPLRVLAVGEAAWFEALERLPGVDVERVAARAVGERLGRCDVLVASDVDLRALPAAVADFVRWGGAFVCVPGDSTLAGWRSKSPLAPLLPLQLVQEDARPRSIVVLIDGSGSMAGDAERAARAGAIELARAAGDDERVEVRFFTDKLGAVFTLGARESDAREREVRALLDARAPSGPTAIVGALSELATQRSRAADRALVFLVSDGRDEAGADERAARRARAELAATGARLVVCALGADGATPILDALLLPGEAAVHAERPEDLARVFAHESAKRDLVEDGPIAALARSSGDLGPESFEALLAESLPRTLAPLARRVRARTGAMAKALVVDAEGEPLVAVARVGLGTTFAAAAAPDERWTADFSAWRVLLATAVDSLARGAHEHTRARPRARLGPDGLELENVPAAWPAELIAHLSPLDDPAATPLSIHLAPADGRDGSDPRTVRRAPRRQLESLKPGPCALRVGARGALLWSTTVVQPTRPEFASEPGTWPPSLPAAGPTGSTGGSDDRGGGPHPWAWKLLAGGLAAVFAGAVLRLSGRA
ncbi:MAG: VWA domain-containing protein [Planctomycetes bacterium]|nr:VWA domain-containing protein [Planctomycetota bacterium]